MKENGYQIDKIILDNGLRVISSTIPGRKAVSIGVWVLSGSADESSDKAGISHLLEHMVFKGTEKYDAKELVSTIERLGGYIDAYSARQETCFNCSVLSEDLPVALDTLSQIVAKPRLNFHDLELEREVVISEMNESVENPESLAADLFPVLMLGKSSLGCPIMGNLKSVSSIIAEDLKDYWRKNYCSSNIIVGATGDVNFENFSNLVRDKFSGVPVGKVIKTYDRKNGANGKITIIHHNSQMVHVFIGVRTFPYKDSHRYILALIDSILGRGSSGRLFQNIREKKGLAYNIQSFSEYYLQDGYWAIYAATSPKKLNELIVCVLDELRQLRNNLISDNELNEVKSFIRRRFLLSMDNMWRVISRAIETEVHLGRYIQISETLEKFLKVDAEQILQLANRLFEPSKLVIMVMGPIEEVPEMGFERIHCTPNEIYPIGS
jgi:predicted Zn-dependent peptidase